MVTFKVGKRNAELLLRSRYETVPNPDLIISADPTPGDVQYREDRIYEFNSSATGITHGQWLAIFVRDYDGRIVAGICGNTWGACAEIRQFWVEEARRKQGLGTRLLEAAKQEARKRGLPTDNPHDVQLPGSRLLCEPRI